MGEGRTKDSSTQIEENVTVGGVSAKRTLASGWDGSAINDAEVTSDGQLNVVAGTKISTANSSTSALNTGTSFTGTWEDVSNFDSVVVAIKTDQNGTFSVQFSPDGTNQDSTLTRYYRTGQVEVPHRFTITRQYCRVVFTNDSGTNQTSFRMQTMYKGTSQNLNAPMDSTLSQDFDSIAVRPTDFHTEVALGRRQGKTTWNKFGYNSDVDTTTDPEIIASWGGTFGYITTGETMDVVSSSTNDDLVGTGCQRIIIYGVDSNWDTATEIVDMDGTSTVTTTTSFIGINRVAIYKAGSGAKNDGTITITGNTTTGTTFAQMPVGEGTSQQMILYVPRNHQFLAEWLYFNVTKTSGGSQPEVTLKGWVYSDVATAEFEVYRDGIDVADNEHIELTPPVPFVIGEKSILWFTAETDTNDTSVRGRFSGELVRDADG